MRMYLNVPLAKKEFFPLWRADLSVVLNGGSEIWLLLAQGIWMTLCPSFLQQRASAA